ncbi:MAG: hypothetical protein E7158_04870 [Firmicutes bacterium]|nr:hypothetical protein [Bacillota bacterium]
MEEIYKKIISGEINIKYLSPTDLIKLEIYLKQMNISLNTLLKIIKEKNNKLDNRKQELEYEIFLEETTMS